VYGIVYWPVCDFGYLDGVWESLDGVKAGGFFGRWIGHVIDVWPGQVDEWFINLIVVVRCAHS
jgi:hypothetical protein